MHDEIYQALSKLNDAVSHAQGTLEKHGRDDALEDQLCRLEAATQDLWDACQSESDPTFEMDADIIAKLDGLAAQSGLERDDVARLMIGKGWQLVRPSAGKGSGNE